MLQIISVGRGGAVRVQKRAHGITGAAVKVGARRTQDGTKAALEEMGGGGYEKQATENGAKS